MTHSVEEVVARYVALREEKERIEKEYKEKLEIISDWLRRHMDSQGGIKSLRTTAGTVSLKMRRTPKIANIDEFEVFADDNPDAWKRTLNSTFVLERLDSGGALPPGVAMDSTYFISVTSN
ncbi:MAG: hypothetical protein KGL63_13720 [Betaproteobacteria bacterium]|nr:hypothetical protein [Betaproteobacteria bacterium]